MSLRERVNNLKIDFVVTWVDGNDQNWRMSKNKYLPEDEQLNKTERYREYGTFKYWFRAVEKYAPWVNKIYLVTEGHLPEWLNIDSPKLVHVRHSDYMPKEYLPTFSSNPIQLNLHRIKGLSEHFVLFNDDLFLNNPVEKKDFFINGIPKEYGIYNVIVPDEDFSKMIFNNVMVINKHFNKRKTLNKYRNKFFRIRYGKLLLRTILTLPWKNVTGYYNSHLTTPLLKSTYEEVWKLEFEELNKTSNNKFRTNEDVTDWLFRYWQIESGNFEPQYNKFGKYFELDDLPEISRQLLLNKYKVICINDVITDKLIDFDELMERLTNVFEKKFPEKCEYEK